MSNPQQRTALINKRYSFSPTRISVIVPTLNEADQIAKTLASVGTQPNVEVLVVDGGSSDATPVIAQSHNARVLLSAPGRAKQMNLGAAMAQGKALLFLHADSRLPNDWEHLVGSAMSDPEIVGGAFQLKIEDSGRSLALIAALANWRTRRWSLPYGDQAIFIRREAFEQLGGYEDVPIMEDYRLVRKLVQMGQITILDQPVVTSSRRWKEIGILKTTLINQAILLGHYLRVPPTRLARWAGRTT